MPAVEKITIEGFKSISSAEVELRPINVLIGANGSGKSNFIGAFGFLQAIRSRRLQDYVARAGGAERILHFESGVTDPLTLHICFQANERLQEQNQYEISLSPAETDRLFPSSEYVYFWTRGDTKDLILIRCPTFSTMAKPESVIPSPAK